MMDTEEQRQDGTTGGEGSQQTIKVRQGITGQGVRYVLAFGLLGIVIAFAVVALTH